MARQPCGCGIQGIPLLMRGWDLQNNTTKKGEEKKITWVQGLH